MSYIVTKIGIALALRCISIYTQKLAAACMGPLSEQREILSVNVYIDRYAESDTCCQSMKDDNVTNEFDTVLGPIMMSFDG